MICYKDRVFCLFLECKNSKECKIALTKEVKDKAAKWWESFNSKDEVPIQIYKDKPECFKDGI